MACSEWEVVVDRNHVWSPGPGNSAAGYEVKAIANAAPNWSNCSQVSAAVVERDLDLVNEQDSLMPTTNLE